MQIKINERDEANWVSGSLDSYTFEAKVFNEPSIYGIPTPRFEDGGNVSILIIRDEDGREVFLFDRGRYSGMVLHCAETAAEIVAELEATFCMVGE